MILYFSGTGNSEYVAKRIARTTNDEALNLFEKIRNKDFAPVNSDRPWIVVSPTYAWRIPSILQSWLRKTELTGNSDIYFLMTCGGSIGNAGKYLKKLTDTKGMRYRGCCPVVMPENYIALFTTPTSEQALDTVEKAEKEIDKVAELIATGRNFPQNLITWRDRISSGLVNILFYPMFVHAKKFVSTDACVSCGKCATVCPLENIRIQNGKPSWGDDCTHCMACICRCPTTAIEYGKHSKGLPRYTCPK